MADYLQHFSAWFWNAEVWLPPHLNWTSLKEEYDEYPEFSEMYWPIPYAFVLLIFRFVFEWTFARPLGRWLGIVDTESELTNIFRWIYNRLKPIGSPLLLLHVVNPKNKHLVPKSVLDKFSETTFRFLFYFSIFWYGLYVLWDKPWFTDQATCWYGYPLQSVPSEIKLYYVLESSFYWSLTISLITDVHRKDFTMQFVHHIATITLLWLSWTSNFVRIGSLVLIVHDVSDVIIEGGKMARYAGYQNVCNGFFALFIISWFLTRTGIYPFTIVYSTMVEAPVLIPWFPVYYIFNALLFLLLILHILWSIMIMKMVIGFLKRGVAEDTRSDDEDDSS